MTKRNKDVKILKTDKERYLMKHLSLLTTLLLTSSMVYAGWTRYLDGGEQTPKGDCLEMICEYGCVEDDKGKAPLSFHRS